MEISEPQQANKKERRKYPTRRRALDIEELKTLLTECGAAKCRFNDQEASTLQTVAKNVDTIKQVSFRMVIKSLINLMLACGIAGAIALLFRAFKE
jgi:hypothetical protein